MQRRFARREKKLCVAVATVVGDSLRTNADVAPSGFVKVTALDENGEELGDGELIAKTVTDAEIQWKDGFDFENLKGKRIALRFELRESKLFSFSFEQRSGLSA